MIVEILSILYAGVLKAGPAVSLHIVTIYTSDLYGGPKTTPGGQSLLIGGEVYN